MHEPRGMKRRQTGERLKREGDGRPLRDPRLGELGEGTSTRTLEHEHGLIPIVVFAHHVEDANHVARVDTGGDTRLGGEQRPSVFPSRAHGTLQHDRRRQIDVSTQLDTTRRRLVETRDDAIRLVELSAQSTEAHA